MSCSADSLSWKGILYTEIKPKNSTKTLHVISTHLQAQYNVYTDNLKDKNKLEKSKIGYQTRLSQASELREFIEKLYVEKGIIEGDLNNIVIVVGDLNIDSRTSPKLPKSFIRDVGKDFRGFMEVFLKSQQF